MYGMVWRHVKQSLNEDVLHADTHAHPNITHAHTHPRCLSFSWILNTHLGDIKSSFGIIWCFYLFKLLVHSFLSPGGEGSGRHPTYGGTTGEGREGDPKIGGKGKYKAIWGGNRIRRDSPPSWVRGVSGELGRGAYEP